jgi:anti-sigma regulatory factor (Ser/Thr protein kinase)
MELPADPTAPAKARIVIARAVSDVLDEKRLDALRLGVSEVVTNAVLHGSSSEQAVDIALEVRADAIRVKVTQSESAFDRPDHPTPRPDGTGGYGLPLLEAVTDRWDVDPGPPPYVWFEMELLVGT